MKKKIGAIIAEYNPFHNGHDYQIKKAKKDLGLDALIVVMSQDIVQRGSFANFDKYWRAEKALESGADLILGLPSIVSNQSAEFFSKGALDILSKFPVTHLIFGAETDDLKGLKKLANILNSESESFQNTLRKQLKDGQNFATSRSEAIRINYPEISEELINQPNNILAIEYLKYIQKASLNIKPYLIQRTGAAYHDTNLSPMASATGIRNALENNVVSHNEMVPYSTQELRDHFQKTNYDLLYNSLATRLLTTPKKVLLNINHINKDILNRILKNFTATTNFVELSKIIKTKNINHSSLNRLLMNITLGITKDDLKKYYLNDYNPYIRILGFNQIGQELLKSSDDNFVSRPKDIKKLNKEQKYFMEQDLKISTFRDMILGLNNSRIENRKGPIIINN